MQRKTNKRIPADELVYAADINQSTNRHAHELERIYVIRSLPTGYTKIWKFNTSNREPMNVKNSLKKI